MDLGKQHVELLLAIGKYLIDENGDRSVLYNELGFDKKLVSDGFKLYTEHAAVKEAKSLPEALQRITIAKDSRRTYGPAPKLSEAKLRKIKEESAKAIRTSELYY